MRTHFDAAALTESAFASSEQQIRKCVHCGFCLATCPTYLLLGDERDSPRGRIYMIKDMLEKARAPTTEVVRHVDRCLSCLACASTCPSGVNYMQLVDHARAYIETHYRRPLIDRLWRRLLATVLPHPARLRAALFVARGLQPWIPSAHDDRSTKPLAALLSLAPAVKVGGAVRSRLPPPSGKLRLALLEGCAEPVLRPEIRAATLRILRRAGFDVGSVAGEGCCGALVHHLGRERDALDAARRNVDAWMRTLDAGGLSAIVVTASGCGTMLKNYGFLLRADPLYAERAARVAALAKDVCEVLDEVGLPPRTGGAPLKVAYLSACSLQHGQKIGAAPQRLLAAAGFQVVELAEAHLCCGSAGTYNILQPHIARQLRARKAAQVRDSGAAVLAAGNIGCLTQMADAVAMPIVHTVELLDWATGGPKPRTLA